MRLSTTTLARASARRPWLTLALWGAALVAAGAIIALVLPGTLTAQYSFLGDPGLPARPRPAGAAPGHAAEGQRGRHRALHAVDGDRPGVPLGGARRPARHQRPRAGRRRRRRERLPRRRQDAHLRRRPHGDHPGRHGRRPHRRRRRTSTRSTRSCTPPTARAAFDTLVTGAASINSDFSQHRRDGPAQGRGHRRARSRWSSC